MQPGEGERRTHHELRELLDELVVHVRSLVREGRTMAPDQVHFAQQRLEWLADEIWRSATVVKSSTDRNR